MNNLTNTDELDVSIFEILFHLFQSDDEHLKYYNIN